MSDGAVLGPSMSCQAMAYSCPRGEVVARS